MNWDELRSLFPITRTKVYLFNGNIIPCAIPVHHAIQRYLEIWSQAGDGCWQIGAAVYTEAKNLFCELINAPADTIVGIPNTTTGLNMAALMIRPKPGQNVIVTELEHMSDVYPWLPYKTHGVEIRYVPARGGAIDMEEFANALDDNTASVSISHVTMGTGFRWDLPELCRVAHQHGARVVIDAAQSAGAVPIDVLASGVDILATPTFKWLLGPLGAGFLYICPELIIKCDPPLPGWFGVTNPNDNALHDPNWYRTAPKFERGVPNLIRFVWAGAGMRLLRDIGLVNVFGKIAELSTYVYDGLADLGVRLLTPKQPEHRAGIVAMQMANQDRLWRHLEEANIHVGNWLGCLRIDPGCYNTKDELDEFLHQVRDFV
jgi:selenocysteine lyase/cysteine desulfurase